MKQCPLTPLVLILEENKSETVLGKIHMFWTMLATMTGTKLPKSCKIDGHLHNKDGDLE